MCNFKQCDSRLGVVLIFVVWSSCFYNVFNAVLEDVCKDSKPILAHVVAPCWPMFANICAILRQLGDKLARKAAERKQLTRNKLAQKWNGDPGQGKATPTPFARKEGPPTWRKNLLRGRKTGRSTIERKSGTLCRPLKGSADGLMGALGSPADALG